MSHDYNFYCRTHQDEPDHGEINHGNEILKGIWNVRYCLKDAEKGLWLGLLFYDGESAATNFAMEHSECDVVIRSEYHSDENPEKYPDFELNVVKPGFYRHSSGRLVKWTLTEEERPKNEDGSYTAECYDCGKAYKHCGDCSVSNEDWELINPTEFQGAGILCANCMIERFHHISKYGVKAKLW
jgi:hypothetical protein